MNRIRGDGGVADFSATPFILWERGLKNGNICKIHEKNLKDIA